LGRWQKKYPEVFCRIRVEVGPPAIILPVIPGDEETIIVDIDFRQGVKSVPTPTEEDKAKVFRNEHTPFK
jgi:hypothetical protein